MSRLTDLLSEINPGAASPSPVSSVKQTPLPSGPKPAPRPAVGADGVVYPSVLKRKASGLLGDNQAKIQRRDGHPQNDKANGTARPNPPTSAASSKPPTPSTSVPYKGTAGLTASKPTVAAKKPSPGTSSQSVSLKPAAPVPKPPGSASTSGAASAQAKKGSYAAMLQKAKEVQQAKPAPPPVKHEPTKILSKKERLALRAEASAIAKGKKPSTGGLARNTDSKGDTLKQKRKPAELGYQGTARPAKKPVEIAYKGTAKPSTTGGPPGRVGASAAAKSKPKLAQGRYGGYASWSDEEMMDEEEEEDYESDESNMEGGLWDVEEEETLALKAAKKEDAEALAEENELKRQKEERRRKLVQMSKAAAARKRY